MAAPSSTAATAATASAAAQRRRYGCISEDMRIPSGRHFFQCLPVLRERRPLALLRALAHVVQALDDQQRLLLHIPIKRQLVAPVFEECSTAKQLKLFSAV